MLILGPIGFTAPWILLGLIVLPILWLLLRAVPPAPIRRRFPGVALLLGLKDEEHQADKTPWWLLLLRSLAIAALIAGFAGPVLNPDPRTAASGPLLVLMDGTWSDARDWPRRIERVEQALDEAARDGRTAALVVLTDRPEGELPFRAAQSWKAQLAGLTPAPWAPEGAADWAARLDGAFDTIWLSDGLAYDWRAEVLTALEARGAVSVFESPRPIYGLRPAAFEDGAIALSLTRARPEGAATVTVAASGLDPNGVERELATAELEFEDGATEAELSLSLPPELRNRVSRFEVIGTRSAGAVTLTDDALKRREVALIAGQDDREGLELLNPTHYIEQALDPVADLLDGSLSEVLLANPDAIVLADVATVPAGQADQLREWVEDGGLLVRFAGPRVAASDLSRDREEPLMPVRLRAGGRSVGGAMSWGEPKTLRAFDADSPFSGLSIPEDVSVNAQVLAEPDPELSDRTIASLADGTPLVTRKRIGAGQVVLFHVTANAEWSSLPLSGLFVSMLERLAVSTRPSQPDAEELAGTTWTIDQRLTAFGQVEEAGTLPGVPGERLAAGEPGPEAPPGLYAGEDRRIALNVVGPETSLTPAIWPARIPVEGLRTSEERSLAGLLLSLGLGLLALDVLAALWLAGRLTGPRAAAVVAALAFMPLGGEVRAQQAAATTDEGFAVDVTSEVTLAHVLTGNPEVDRVAAAGLEGLGQTLFRRTSVEPAAPVGVNVEEDELALLPFLYWPVTADMERPSDEAYAKLNAYLRTGGMILFDTRDADVSSAGGATATSRMLQELARPLDIPPLEQIPDDHVLTRTFYLLQDFPGRHREGTIWVEAAPPGAEEAVEGMPFRDLNDNVTPVVIGGNDWAAAWAVDEQGRRMFPVGRGFAGEQQREIALRFGVNLIMHVLTGNYKSDQVHVPALLDRLGN
ncbi:N-terminal double-transmembrane domain-containing protein [Palleronia marisminoris]|uniref:Aerotolerance regulator N-terminal domain-containing protein n=1 Tax=Palleronia marisminoris TaxID=315423 RepID=A0A1Y5SZ20_9RHOB|nr:DUF4159 domain-containing protein [Palleronia marisminoris]SFG99073.1 N-terminal double-transmembrane domain-containing protein [Palleronia marisminoris]SLN48350.1 hypothetical protein PAM7066_02184 [Palleronia marisminoris]